MNRIFSKDATRRPGQINQFQLVIAQAIDELGARGIQAGVDGYDAAFLYSQASLESDFSSRIYRETGNLFGMGAPNSRRLYSSILQVPGTEGNKADYDPNTKVFAARTTPPVPLAPEVVSVMDALWLASQKGIQPGNYFRGTLTARPLFNSNPDYGKAWLARHESIFGSSSKSAAEGRRTLAGLRTGTAPLGIPGTGATSYLTLAALIIVGAAIIKKSQD